jgi:NADPH-dependent 2,4-dienoyl-CoA reductase/sulfur reductase-like enzyme
MIGPALIVGAGHAGFQLAASLRQAGFDGRICLINDEVHPPYQRPPLSKAHLKGAGVQDSLIFRPEKFYRDQNIVIGDRALSPHRETGLRRLMPLRLACRPAAGMRLRRHPVRLTSRNRRRTRCCGFFRNRSTLLNDEGAAIRLSTCPLRGGLL